MNSIAAVLLPAFFWLTFLSKPLEAVSPVLSNSDELLVIVAFVVSLWDGQIKREHFRILTMLFLFWVYAVLTSALSPYYRGPSLTVLDLFLFSKPILLYIGLMNLPQPVIRKFLKRVMPLVYIYLFSAFLMYFVNYVTKMFPVFDRRFGIASYSFIARNPGELANLVFISGILVYSFSKSARMRQLAIGLMSFLSLASLRFKAIVLSALYILLLGARRIGLIQKKHITTATGEVDTVNRLKLGYLLAVLPFGLIPGAGQFTNYFLGELTPRLFFVQKSAEVARDYFPFGTGSGTFGSTIAKNHYSDLYLDLGFADKWGLSADEGLFLSDNFWPMVIAQYGVAGLVMILIIYTLIAKNLLLHWSPNYRLSIGATSILLNLILSTLGAAILIGGLGVLLISTMVFLLREE
jgi:hypothetical protein